MAQNKRTKAQMFNFIKFVMGTIDTTGYCENDVITNDEVDEFLAHELLLLAKKSANKKPTKTQEQNEVLKEKILEVLATFENGATASEVLGADAAFAGLSNQKISTLLNQLVKVGDVVKSTDSRKSIFSVA